MGGAPSKQEFRTAILDLVNSNQSVTTLDGSFWDRFWSDPTLSVADYFSMVTCQDIRTLRDKASGNLTALCFKVVERITSAAATACTGENEHRIVLNCVSLLTRLLPFLFEAPDWRLLFWSPANFLETPEGEQPQALAQVLLNSLADLLFCPDFTVIAKSSTGPEKPDDLSSLDSCEYIWEVGIGCKVSPGTTKQMDNNRSAIIKLLITCFSEALYYSPTELSSNNRWLSHFTSPENRHVLPLLTSLLNSICNYDPVGYGVPYYYTMVDDPRGSLVEGAIQLLFILLDYTPPLDLARSMQQRQQAGGDGGMAMAITAESPRGAATDLVEPGMRNLFCSFVSRLHQNDDLEFIAKGLTSLLMNPLKQTYLPYSIKKIYFSQELYIIFWKMFELNHKFLVHMLRSSSLFDLVVPLLYQLLQTRTNPALVGMLHVGVFILLLLSGERNFGVRLNKPFQQKIPFSDIPKCNGTHADLLFLVFHKIITSGLPRLQPLYDCLLTVLVNVSPYLKSLSMVTCARLLHLMESFATPWFLFAKPTNHYLVFYLLEIFNNIIQYQFDGNTNLIYSIIRSKTVFYQLANLPEDSYQLVKSRSGAGSKEAEEGEGEDRQASGVPPGVATGEVGVGDGPSVSASSNGNRVADIRPPGRIHTVQVEVEPNVGESEEAEEEAGGEEEAKREVGGGETGRESVDKGDRGGEGEGEAGKESGGEVGENGVREGENEKADTVEELRERQEQGNSSPAPLQASTQKLAAPASERSALGRISPHSLPTVAEGLQEAASKKASTGKKSKKSKPLSTRDLLPLHQDIGRSNKQLLEPATPEFKPTPEWVRAWKHKLPLNTVLRVLQVLVPQVEKLCTENDVKSEHEVLDYLKNGTLVGLLPVPHPILIRKYQTSDSTELWFHTYIWGVIYVRNFDPPIWYDTTIKLFQVHKTEAPEAAS